MFRAWGNEYIFGCLRSDIIKYKILSKKDLDAFYEPISIHPDENTRKQWKFRDKVEDIIELAIESKKVKVHMNEGVFKSSTAPYVIGDGMTDTVNPVDGKTYDSKSSYYKAVRAAGCEIVGNEKMPQKKQETSADAGLKQELARAIYN